MKIRNAKRLLTAAAMGMALLTGLFGNGTITAALAAEETHEVSLKDDRYWLTYDDGTILKVGYYEIDGGTQAMCCCHELAGPDEGDVLTSCEVYTASDTDELSRNLRKVCYYGYGGPAHADENDGELWRATSLALSYVYGHKDDNRGDGKAFWERICDYEDAPEGLNVYVLSNGNTEAQNLIYFTFTPSVPETESEVPEDATLTVEKTSDCAELSSGTAGAVYTVFSDKEMTVKAGEITTDAEGKGSISLDPGTYYVAETAAPEGYLKDEEVYTVTLMSGEDKKLSVTDVPSGSITVRKLWEDHENVLGQRPDSLNVTVNGSIGGKASVSYQLVLDEDNNWQEEIENVPLSQDGQKITWSAEELNTGAYVTVTDQKSEGSLITLTITNHLGAGRFCFVKKNSEDGSVMAGIPFELTGEDDTRITFETDENGAYTSDWLACGEYQLTELACDANFGKVLYRGKVTVSDSEEVISLGDIVNENMIISTTAAETGSGSDRIMAGTDTSITDTVMYRGLDPEKTYTLTGRLINASTGEVLKDENGKEITAQTAFIPESDEGTAKVVFTFDSLDFAGVDAVVFESLYEGETLIASHEDLKDEDQTVHFYENPGTVKTGSGEHILYMGIGGAGFLSAGLILMLWISLKKKRTGLKKYE